MQVLARYSKALSHPARLLILQYLAETKICISGDISDNIPLGRSTVSQHLKELKQAGLISGEIDGLRINYCLNDSEIIRLTELLTGFLHRLGKTETNCC